MDFQESSETKDIEHDLEIAWASNDNG